MIVDLYLSRLQTNEAKRKVLAAPSRTSFFDIAATRVATSALHEGGEYPRVVTWPVYLEHKLRRLAGSTISAELLDSIHEAFIEHGGRKGYLDQEDLGFSDDARSLAQAGLGASGGPIRVAAGGSIHEAAGAGGGGLCRSGSFAEPPLTPGPLTPVANGRGTPSSARGGGMAAGQGGGGAGWSPAAREAGHLPGPAPAPRNLDSVLMESVTEDVEVPRALPGGAVERHGHQGSG
jgi:hypothetical protein